MKPPSQTETDLPPPPFGGAQGAAHRFAQDLHQARYRTSQPEQLLGEGGIGRVVIAEETLLRRPVAMKTLRDDRTGELYEARLIREARITGLLEHPSIVPVHDIGRNDDGKIYYTMKKVVGLTLREVIEHLRPATSDTTDEAKALRKSVQERFGSIPARLSLFQKVCDAIAFAHAHPLRVIHRDLKPENIMVGEFGEVLVMDWGLAKVLVTDEEALSEALPLESSSDQASPACFTVSRIALSTAGQFVGTPMYAAPEQLEGRLEDIDEKSDVYALGGVLYHLLTLEAPISSESQDTAENKSSDTATQTAKTRGSAPDWDALVRFIRGGHVAPLLRERTDSKSIPEPLRPLLQCALAPDRSQRIASVSALQQAISQFLAGYANDFELAGAWKHFVYFVKRHKGVALASAAALIIIASLTAGFTRKVTHEKDRAQAEAERANKAEIETSKQLAETNRQLERSQLEEGRAWLESAKVAKNNGDHLGALMLAGRAVGFQGYGRLPNETMMFTEQFPRLLGKPMRDPVLEKEREQSANQICSFMETVRPITIPLWQNTLSGSFKFVVFSPDGTLLASGSHDNAIKLWDTASGREVFTLRGHKSDVMCIAFSPDSTRLASGSTDTTIRLWDTALGKQLSIIPNEEGSVNSVSFSPDGSRLVSGSDGITIWDAISGRKMHSSKGSETTIECVAFSPDGTRIAGAANEVINIWNASDIEDRVTFTGHTGRVWKVSFSCDNSRLASASADRTLRVWDLEEGKESGVPMRHPKIVWDAAFNPNGTFVASASGSSEGDWDSPIKFLDSDTGEEFAIINGHEWAVRSIAISPDGTHLASASDDETIKIWDISGDLELTSLNNHTDSVSSVSFLHDGSLLASVSDDMTLRFWDVVTGMELASFDTDDMEPGRVAFSPDGSRLACELDHGKIMLLDCATWFRVSNISDLDKEEVEQWMANTNLQLMEGSSPQTSLDNLIKATARGSRIFIQPNSAILDLTAPLRVGLLALPGRELQFPTITHTTMLHVRQDTLAKLAGPALMPERRAELRMELCTKSSQFRAATAQWQRLLQGEWPGFENTTVPKHQAPATIRGDSPIRRLYLLALIDATKHSQIHGHPTICQTAAQIAPVLTKEMMAMPTISLAMMSLMQTLTEDESADMKAPRDSLLKKLNEVASPEWLAALQASTMKP